MYIATAYVHAANKKQHDCVSSLEKLWQNPVFNSADNESETPENTEQKQLLGLFSLHGLCAQFNIWMHHKNSTRSLLNYMIYLTVMHKEKQMNYLQSELSAIQEYINWSDLDHSTLTFKIVGYKVLLWLQVMRLWEE